MKRDMSLIREILLVCEQAHGVIDITDMGTTQEDKDLVAYHTELLIDAGYIIGKVTKGSSGYAVRAYIQRMTWQGTELLEKMKNETVFKAALKKLLTSCGVVTIGMLEKAAEQELGKLL